MKRPQHIAFWIFSVIFCLSMLAGICELFGLPVWHTAARQARRADMPFVFWVYGLRSSRFETPSANCR